LKERAGIHTDRDKQTEHTEVGRDTKREHLRVQIFFWKQKTGKEFLSDNSDR